MAKDDRGEYIRYMKLLEVATFTISNVKIYCAGAERAINRVEKYIETKAEPMELNGLYTVLEENSIYMHFSADYSLKDDAVVAMLNQRAARDGLYISAEEWADAHRCSIIEMNRFL